MDSKNLKIAVIGGGFMGSVIAQSVSKAFPETEICVSDINTAVSSKFADYRNIKTTSDSVSAAKWADIIYLAVKPNIILSVLNEIKYSLDENKLLVSLAAGISIHTIEESVSNICVARIMPNICAKVNEACMAYCGNIGKEWEEILVNLLSALGKPVKCTEKLMDAVTGLSGSGPAFIFMLIEALSDGGVLCGLPRDTANMLAAQTVLGSAKMYLESGKHAGELKDMVTSPGGTTIEGIKALEEKGFRNAVMEAVKKATEKSKNLS